MSDQTSTRMASSVADAMLRAMSAKVEIRRLRMVGQVEAVSFLLLLGVAMPLKYLAGIPLAVKVVGWTHGLLFMGFCIALIQAKSAANWSLSRSALS